MAPIKTWLPAFLGGALFLVLALFGVPLRGTESPLALGVIGGLLLAASLAAGLFPRR